MVKSIKKPTLDTEGALSFAESGDSAQSAKDTTQLEKVAKTATGEAAKSGLVPEGDVRLTANIRSDLHLKLKIAAAERRTTIGELIEDLVENHL